MSLPKPRKIIHVDMDAFYASVEQLDFPELKGKPLAVGGSKDRGVVAAASYEARKFGVHSALASSIAAKRCPDLIFVKPRFNRYREVSEKVMQIFKRYTDLVEPLSLDEAFLDVTHNKKKLKSAIKIALLIRKEILEETGLTASAGVSFNKFLAKTASDLNKPNGMAVILEEEAKEFMKRLKIEKFHGIGKKTAEKMKAQGIFTGADLMKLEKRDLIRTYGKAGNHYYNIIHANDIRPVKPNRIRKSIGAESTFSEDLKLESAYLEELKGITEKVVKRLKSKGRKGKTITLKIKYSDFEQKTRSKTLVSYTDDNELIMNAVVDLVRQEKILDKGVRLLGVSVSQLDQIMQEEHGQLTIKF